MCASCRIITRSGFLNFVYTKSESKLDLLRPNCQSVALLPSYFFYLLLLCRHMIRINQCSSVCLCNYRKNATFDLLSD